MNLLEIRKLIDSGKSFYDIPLKVVYYARVSTDKDEQLNSLSNQTRYYEEFIKSNRNWTYCGGYIDEGISGTSVKKRENFLKMISDARAHKFDYIITKEISRFSRNTLDSIKYTRELLSYGVGVFFQNDSINTLAGDAELRLTIMASIAQDEVRKLSERVRFGFKRAQENGVVLGQNNIYGYSKNGGVLTVNESEAAVVETIFRRYSEGKLGLRRIAIDLEKEGILSPSGKLFTYGTLYNIIRNPKYKGYYAGHKYTSLDYRDNRKIKLKPDEWLVYKDDDIPAIVTDELWDKANRLLDERGRKFKDKEGGFQQRYGYSGKIWCAEHNTSYHRHVYKNRQGERECWNCRMYRLKGKTDGCDSPTLYTSELDTVMSRIYSGIYINRNEIINGLLTLYSETQTDTEPIEKELARLYYSKDKLLDLSIDGSIPNSEFKERNDIFNLKIAELTDKLEKHRSESVDSEWTERLKRIIESKLSENEFSCSEINSILLDKIIVSKNEDKNHIFLEIHLKTGRTVSADFLKAAKSISLYETGISQAQVSRLEKGALERIRKQL